MMACLNFMSHLFDESLSNSGQPRDCHVRYNLSHSKYKLVCYIVTMGDSSWTIRRQAVMRWSVMSGPQLLYNAYVMHINYGIMLVVMNNVVCPTCLSSVPEATCLIARPTCYNV